MAEETTPAPKSGVKIKVVAGKRDQAKKRQRQIVKRTKINAAHKSKVHTAKRKLADLIEKKESKETLQNQLNEIFSLMDKGAKNGIFKKNKAARTKSRLSARVKA
jgi:small subunit ribosomal protein S20